MARTRRHPALTTRIALVAIVVLACVLGAGPATGVAAAAQATATPATQGQQQADQSGAAGQGAGQGAGTGAGNAAGAKAGGIDINIDTGNKGSSSTAVQILVVLTVLTLVPSILMMVTGFTRIVIVMGFVRNALGTPTMPPNQVLIGLSLFLTIFVMAPTFNAINKAAIQPYQDGKITEQVALDRAQVPLREFMFKQVDEDDLALFVRLADEPRPETRADVPTYVLIPAFMVSEIKTGFQIGFFIFVPFLIIDMVVASTLMSMGMIMLPPVMISLPFKILLFVLVDGWGLTIQSLVVSFGGGG